MDGVPFEIETKRIPCNIIGFKRLLFANVICEAFEWNLNNRPPERSLWAVKKRRQRRLRGQDGGI